MSGGGFEPSCTNAYSPLSPPRGMLQCIRRENPLKGQVDEISNASVIRLNNSYIRACSIELKREWNIAVFAILIAVIAVCHCVSLADSLVEFFFF